MSTLKVNQIEPRVGGDVSIGESGGTVTLATGATAVGFGDESPVKAWVNFNGTNTVSIRDSINVSSITDNGVADYTVNFTTAMPDGNYAISGVAGLNTTSLRCVSQPYTQSPPTTSSVRIQVPSADGVMPNDPNNISVVIFR